MHFIMKKKQNIIVMLLLLATCFFFSSVCAQEKKKDSVAQKDVGDVLRKLFGKKTDSTKPPKQSGGISHSSHTKL